MEAERGERRPRVGSEPAEPEPAFSAAAGSPAPARNRAARGCPRQALAVAAIAANCAPSSIGTVSLALFLLSWHLLTKYRVVFFVRFTNVPSPEFVLKA